MRVHNKFSTESATTILRDLWDNIFWLTLDEGQPREVATEKADAAVATYVKDSFLEYEGEWCSSIMQWIER